MATLLLSAAGAALGGSVGGSFAGLGAMALGKAAGAVIGSAIDQRLLGLGSAPVETGRVERFRVMGSSEGAALARVFGRMRVAGHLIWSSRFLEHVDSERVGGKGGGATVREYSYSVSLAIALCEGEVSRIGRIWADGQPVEQAGLTIRLHRGTEGQLPDPKIEAIEGAGRAPAYRGTAYVVFDDLDLTPYGNRIPQLNFEVFRAPVDLPGVARPAALDVRGVALVPGTGEYALATEPVMFRRDGGDSVVLNVHNDLGRPDLDASLDQLGAELPNVGSVSLVVSWFGDDLRCGACSLRPKVEQTAEDGDPMRWVVSGQGRGGAGVVSRIDGRPVFGGTPADASVLQAIAKLKASGRAVMFYPFLLMDIQAGNGLADPWSDAADQPVVPWRGRITLGKAPGRPGSSDKTPAAAEEVAAFFGQAAVGDFEVSGDTVEYHGSAEWSYRRFILHYAHLCAAAGGVEAFCIGSELRGLTQVRDSADGCPAVRALCNLAADVRAVLGPAVKIGYAADWSEYFGHQPADGSGDVLYHLDPLWASGDIDFIGIDNYMPLSDWRDGAGQADAAAGSIYDLDYLGANVAGGEGFDWYYDGPAGREAQDRLPISDGAYGEHWVFRYKDLVSWWSQPHTNRIGGAKVGGPTAWQPRSKPIWFTELGCPAVDKGTNQPNVFHDPKSSESFFPYYSNGARDDLIQIRYLQATFAHWSDPANNPQSDVYQGRMVDMSRAHVWAWDSRPWPDFPARVDFWSDGGNYERGHWLNGRASIATLGEVVAQICRRCGLEEIDVARLHGAVKGYAIEAVETGRQSLQPLMLAYGFDSFPVDGRLVFANRGGSVVREVDRGRCAVVGSEPVVSLTRAPVAEAADRVTLGFVRADLDYLPGAVEALAPDAAEARTEQTSVQIVFGEGEARAVAERALSEGLIARDTLACALPLSLLSVTPGDMVSLASGGSTDLFRVDRIEEAGHRAATAVRVEPEVYHAPARESPARAAKVFDAPTPARVQFLDLPLLRGDEDPISPHVAVTRRPWAGAVAVYSANQDFGYALDLQVRRPAVAGALLDPLPAGRPGLWMRAAVRVRLGMGSLESRGEVDVLNGANVAALRFGATGNWEVVQFREAVLVEPGEYRLDGWLRGQAGTDAVMPEVWPVGTDVVLLDGAVRQVPLAPAARGIERHYRVGPANRSYGDPSFTHTNIAFDGVGLRPYRPAHLRATRRPDGGIELTWVRRTRVDGDGWQGADVPLGEDAEAYVVRIGTAGAVLRELTVGTPRAIYSAAEQTEDGGAAPVVFEVAQISARFGPGPFERIEFHG
jgi:hypothetical protein